MTTSGTPIEPDDRSALTPDIRPSALEPEPAPTGRPPNAGALASLLGEKADARHVALVGLFVLAVLYTLHFAQAFILPIVLSVLLDFLLSPVVRWLRRVGISEPIGAGIVVVGVLAVVGYGGYRLTGPAAEWIARAPESTAAVQQKLESLRRPVERVTQAAEEMEKATEVGRESAAVELKGPGLTKQLFGGTTAFMGAATVVIFLTYFLLAVGDLFLQKLVTVLPQFNDKKKAVAIARETEEQISVYLFTTTLINIGVGVVTGIALGLVGMPNPVLWGVLAGVLNFIPYLGAVINTVILGLASVVTFERTTDALIPPAVFLILNLIESNLVTPLILGKRMRLNTVALFIGLIFWWYLWGITGAILAVPIMAAFKIMCDHIESLAPVGEFLGT